MILPRYFVLIVTVFGNKKKKVKKRVKTRTGLGEEEGKKGNL